MLVIRLRYILVMSVLAISAITTTSVVAQVDAQFTQYWAVPNYYNPAAVGNTDFLNIVGGTRMQWVGMPDAPNTFLVSADMPYMLFKKKVGFGVVLQQETLGLYSSMSGGLQLSYKLKLFGGELGLGVQLGLLNETFRGSEVELPSGDDESQSSTDEGIPTTDIGGMAFDAGLGVFYKHKYFWASLSATHLTQPTISMSSDGVGDEEESYEFTAGAAFYFMAGSNIQIKNTLFEIQPTMLVRSDLMVFQAEATARLIYRKFLSAGLGYRMNDAVSLLLGAEYKNFYFGYSYDYHTSALSKATSGSHEIFVAYKMKMDFSDKSNNKYKSIRIM